MLEHYLSNALRGKGWHILSKPEPSVSPKKEAQFLKTVIYLQPIQGWYPIQGTLYPQRPIPPEFGKKRRKL